MSFLQLLPVILSLLLLGAHTLKIGEPLLIIIPLAVLVLLAWPRPWTARLAQMTLVLGAAEWLRVTVTYVKARIAFGEDWRRLAAILVGVALFTFASALVFRTRRLRRRYRIGPS